MKAFNDLADFSREEIKALVELAAGRAERGDFPHPDEIRPIYLREPDVAIGWKSIRREGPWPGSQ